MIKTPPTKSPKKRKKRKPFNLDECTDIAEASFSSDTSSWREERGPLGNFVTSFLVPLDVCPPINRFSIMHYFTRAHLKEKALRIMFQQYGKRRLRPLTGRPIILAVRFSSMRPDDETSWHKIIIDRLQTKHEGLGFITDDNHESIDLRSYWRHAPKGKGFGYVEIWSGGSGLP